MIIKKQLIILLFLFGVSTLIAQNEKQKDAIKTEVVNVVSSYTPTIADATKIKKKPSINFIEKSKKKEMKYTIFSAPVTSTFTPKTGVIKGLNYGVKEKLYSNYVALGFGNFNTPFAEVFLHKNNRFKNEYGFYTNYISSKNSISDTTLDSYFSNFESSIFYGQKERVFDWKITFNTERNIYNWYGLPNTVNLTNNINEEQRYNFFELVGDLSFKESYINKSKIAFSFFSDAYKSNEIYTSLSTDFSLPLTFINPMADNLKLKTNLELLKGEFKQDYQGLTNLNYSIITASIQPEYQFLFSDFSLKTGFKFYTSIDTGNNINNFLLYPTIEVNTPIIQNYINVYAGISGGLTTNTYKKFTELNPFVSPTLLITQTAEKNNSFLGFNGKITNSINYNIKASYISEEDKPLFIRNNSKSNGTNTNFNGYEYGNSFTVLYDDVKTVSVFGEFGYDLSENIALGITGQFDSYSTTNTAEAWNLPNFSSTIFGKYKAEKWYAETAIFYVGSRKEVNYSAISTPIILDGYLDININGGYHFSDMFSAFLKLNNVLNANYQRFDNFIVQGFQILGGFTYKFDF